MKIKMPKIFLDSGDVEETKRAKGLLGHIDGQTTNPSLVAKNPDVQKFLSSGKKLTEKDLLARYKDLIEQISYQIAGPISVEVQADWQSKAKDMLAQAEEMYTWGKNVNIKFPTIPEGIKAAHQFTKNGGRVNMTLIFNQTQAASVYSATKGSTGSVFISPFVGRWDDRGFDGLLLIKNILKMYKSFDEETNEKSRIYVLAASVRNLRHLYTCIWMGADIITMPISVMREWMGEEKWIPDKNYRYDTLGLKSLVYEEIPYSDDYTTYKIETVPGDLLDKGITGFVNDWKRLIG